MTELTSVKGIYLGNRGEEFKELIKSLLKLAKIKKQFRREILSDETMQLYADAFTSDTVDENNNYQVYEQIGDLTANKFLVTYFYKRFPQLNCSEGVKVVARLRINYGSKESFWGIAESLGFWPFISATLDARQRRKKHLLEDVFEAFIAVTEMVTDRIFLGSGYLAVYRLLEAVFDKLEISIKYEDLYDAKTRLKELFDMDRERIGGTLLYEETKTETLTNSVVYLVSNGRKEVLGRGSGSLKDAAQQQAATSALRTMEGRGFVKYPPAIYARFNTSTPKITTLQDVEKFYRKAGGINAQVKKHKNEYNYTCTALAHYCKRRDFHGIFHALDSGADPNETDSEGMTCTDLLFIGRVDENLCETVLSRFFTKSATVKMHKNVYDAYYVKYTGGFFKKVYKSIEKVDAACNCTTCRETGLETSFSKLKTQ